MLSEFPIHKYNKDFIYHHLFKITIDITEDKN